MLVLLQVLICRIIAEPPTQYTSQPPLTSTASPLSSVLTLTVSDSVCFGFRLRVTATLHLSERKTQSFESPQSSFGTESL